MGYCEFSTNIEEGRKYEQFVYKVFNKIGVTFKHFEGKDAQKAGENNRGLEIKLDTNWKYTGNLYIETVDRVDGGGGIYRDNNTRYFLIGDYTEYWVFKIGLLRELHQQIDQESVDYFAKFGIKVTDRWKYRRVNNTSETSCSQGFLLPIEEANTLCVSHRRIRHHATSK